MAVLDVHRRVDRVRSGGETSSIHSAQEQDEVMSDTESSAVLIGCRALPVRKPHVTTSSTFFNARSMRMRHAGTV